MTKQNWRDAWDELMKVFNIENRLPTNEEVIIEGAAKSFISDLRATDRDNLIKEVEEMKEKIDISGEPILVEFVATEKKIWNSALLAITEKIKEYYKD